jgi:dephospho-CoA kinase
LLKVGLTGGIASGKSTAVARFRELGAVIIDYDVLAREAVAPGSPGLAAITVQFGSEMLDDDGRLDRTKMGELIFQDPAAQGELEAIIHPRVYELAAQAEETAIRHCERSEAIQTPSGDPLLRGLQPRSGFGGSSCGQRSKLVVIHDIPLLVEEHLENQFDVIVVVETEYPTRLERLITVRGLTTSQAQARIAAGATDAQRHLAGDVFLDGNGTPEQLRAQVDQLWECWSANTSQLH